MYTIDFITISTVFFQVIDAPEEYVILTIEGARINDKNQAELLIEQGDIIYVPLEKLYEALPTISPDNIENYLTELCTPTFDIQCLLNGTEALEIYFF